MEHTHHMPAPGARDLARHQGPSCGQIGQSAPAIQRESFSHPALQTCASAGQRLPTVPAIQRPCVFSSSPPATIEADKGAVFCSGRVPCAHWCAPLWFCLHYHEESMGQWDASNVQAGVCELWGIWWPKRAHTGELALWLLLSSSPDSGEGLIVPLTPVWNFWLAEKGSGNECTIQELRGPASGQGRKGITRCIWVHGFDGLAHLISWLCFF